MGCDRRNTLRWYVMPATFAVSAAWLIFVVLTLERVAMNDDRFHRKLPNGIRGEYDMALDRARLVTRCCV